MIVRCRYCGLDVEAPPGSLGQLLRCPSCEETFRCEIPVASIVDEPAPPPPPAPEPEDRLVLDDEVDEEIRLADDPLLAPPDPPPVTDDPIAALIRAEAAEPKPRTRPNPRQWYVIVDGVAAVALTYKELVARAGKGLIRPKDKIYYAPKDATISAGDIPGLYPELDAKRPKPQAPPRARGPLATDAGAAADALAGLEQEAEEVADEDEDS